MARWMTAAVLVVCAGFAGAEDEKAEGAKKPLGSWSRAAGEAEIKFQFKADELQASVTIGGNTIKVIADYGISKDGVVFGRVAKVEKPGDDGPKTGDLFSFQVALTDGTLSVSAMHGPHGPADDRTKQIFEGDYKKAK